MNTARPRSTGYRRLPLLFFGMLSLFGGLAAGLARLGWEVPTFAAQAAALHGPLMIGAFFGTVISLERAVAIGARWAYLAPLAAGSSGLLLLSGGPLGPGQGLASLGALGLIAASVVALRRQTALHTAILTLAAACWLAGNAVWISTGNPAQGTMWWLLFLVLTIAGERLELTRMLPTPAHARTIFVAIVTTLILAVALAADRWLAGGLLAEHSALQKRLAGLKTFPDAVADMQSQLAALLPKDFLVAFPWERLAHFTRYLKAASVRVDKLRNNPARDAQAMAEWKALAQAWERERLARRRAGVEDPALEEFRWLLEELRVGLYAQELKTPMPVSVKRLQKIWDSRPR